MIYISKEFHFHAAHYLPNHPGKCKDIHGHTYKLIVTLKGTLNEHGMIMDFSDLKNIVKSSILKMVDHKMLNEVFDYVPTAEKMVMDFFHRLKVEFSIFLPHILLHSVTLYETETSSATYKEV